MRIRAAIAGSSCRACATSALITVDGLRTIEQNLRTVAARFGLVINGKGNAEEL